MVHVGLDFGSTNTLVSIYDDRTNRPEIVAVQSTESYTIPSYVSYDKKKKKYEFGAKARERMGNKNHTVFRAFKMLLRENDEKKLAEWNYDAQNTPEQIAKLFLENILTDALESLGETEIGTLTVGIPEIWRKTGDRQKRNASNLVREICESLHLAKNVKIVTEPEAASAYFAYRYVDSKHENFNGHILVVDFGGGTLDITLSNVKPGSAGSHQTKYDMQIVTEERTGAGENAVDEISTILKVGNGGILYMESVIDAALKACDIDPVKEKTLRFDKYSKLVRKLEKSMIMNKREIKLTFSDYQSTGIYSEDSLEELDEEVLDSFEYGDEDIEITYGTMARVYQEVIADTFESQLKYIMQYMDHEKIVYRSGNSDTFQLALVGGFGNFYLVREHLERIMGVGAYGEIIVGANECEKAIAHGTALYANDIVGHKYTLPYSFGIRLQDRHAQNIDCYAFYYREEIEPDRVYLAKYKGQPVPIINRKNVFNKFIIKEDRDDSNVEPDVVRLYDKYVEKLRGVSNNSDTSGDRLFIGFSMDENDRLTIYVYDCEKQKYGGSLLNEDTIKQRTPRIVALDDINELFPPTADLDF